MFRWQYLVLTVLALAGGLRVGLAIWLPPEPIWSDGERTYNKAALHILSEGRYPTQEPAPPLQSLVLALVYGLFGFNGTAARITMAVLGTMTCGVLYLLGNMLFDKRVGLIACLILAVYPFHVYLSGIYECPQPTFILLLCITVHQLVSLSQTPNVWRKWISSGILLGLASLAVPTILTAAPFVAIWLLFVCRQCWWRKVLRVTVFTISCSSLVLSWSVYIHVASEEGQASAGNWGLSLYNGNCPLAWQIGKADIEEVYSKQGVPVPEKYRKAYEEYRRVDQQARQFPEGEARNAVYLEATKRFFMERPMEAGLLQLRKAFLYWCPYSLSITQNKYNNQMAKIIQIASFVPILILGLMGMYLQKSRMFQLMPLYIIILSQWATYTGFFVTMRYRSHVDVFLIVLASSAILSIGTKLRGTLELGRKC